VELEEAERPRERLWRLGSGALTEPELLTVLFGSGSGGRSARAVAEGLLAENGGLRALLEQDPHELCSKPGLGPARTAQVLAAVELGRRAQRMIERRPRLRTPREIDAYLRPGLAALRREVFHVLCFNARNVLVRDARIAEGSTSSCPVDPREVFAAALSVRASALVLAHNHPSGDPEPSGLDVALTRQLVEGGRLLGVRVMDHLVVGENGYVSLLERGLMPAIGGARSAFGEVG
jgi:DNA repair protein RadC